METKYLKDFAVALAIIILFAFVLKAANVIKLVNEVPEDSIYKQMALDDQLLEQIQQIEESINDRKEFKFTVIKDPLEQNLIVRTRVDLELEWRKKVDAMMRLAATYIDEHGNKKAAIAYKGKTDIYGIGDQINSNRITDIQSGKITLTSQGRQSVLELKPLPPKPALIDERASKQEYIW